VFSNRAVRPVTSFTKARPARRAFAFLGHLGGCPLLFDQLHQRLAAVWQPVPFLESVDYSDHPRRQLKQYLLKACLAATLAVEAGFFG
jgi:hypothetical protein